MSHIAFDNSLVVLEKSKVALKLYKPLNIEMCILDLSKVLMYEFDYDDSKNKYDNKSKLLFTDTDSLMYNELQVFMKVLTAIKNCLNLVIIQLSQNTDVIILKNLLEWRIKYIRSYQKTQKTK